MAKIRMRTIMVPKLVPVTLVFTSRKLKPAKRKKRKSILSMYFKEFPPKIPRCLMVFDEINSWPAKGSLVAFAKYEDFPKHKDYTTL